MFTITTKPAGTFGLIPDCGRCDAEGLKNPVWLASPGGVDAYGTHCAAVLLGIIEESASQSEARKALTIASREAHEARQQEELIAANADNRLYEAYLAETDQVPSLAAMSGFTAWKDAR